MSAPSSPTSCDAWGPRNALQERFDDPKLPFQPLGLHRWPKPTYRAVWTSGSEIALNKRQNQTRKGAHVDDPLGKLATVLLLDVLEVSLVLAGKRFGVEGGDNDCRRRSRERRGGNIGRRMTRSASRDSVSGRPPLPPLLMSLSASSSPFWPIRRHTSTRGGEPDPANLSSPFVSVLIRATFAQYRDTLECSSSPAGRAT